jgi:hypothetical protein
MQFNALFSNIDGGKFVNLVEFINPYEDLSLSNYNHKAISGRRLVTAILSGLIRSLKPTVRNSRKKAATTSTQSSRIDSNTSSKAVRLVIDSLTHMLILVRERTLIQFVMDLTYLLKNFNANSYADYLINESSESGK